MYAFHYTGKFNSFDWTIYWGGIIAGAFQPALFLHFALAFPEEQESSRRHNWLIGLIYLPAFIVVGLQLAAFEFWSATQQLSHRLDQIATAYLAIYYVLAALMFFISYRRTDIPLRRQQLKWLTRGTVLAVSPFALLYVVPFLMDVPVPGMLKNIAVASLVFLPLTFSWAIVRYRLMDVDLIFKRGVTYTLATAGIVGLYFGVVALAAEVVHTRFPSLRVWGTDHRHHRHSPAFRPIKARHPGVGGPCI